MTAFATETGSNGASGIAARLPEGGPCSRADPQLLPIPHRPVASNAEAVRSPYLPARCFDPARAVSRCRKRSESARRRLGVIESAGKM
jgi:hypothetical protein